MRKAKQLLVFKTSKPPSLPPAPLLAVVRNLYFSVKRHLKPILKHGIFADRRTLEGEKEKNNCALKYLEQDKEEKGEGMSQSKRQAKMFLHQMETRPPHRASISSLSEQRKTRVILQFHKEHKIFVYNYEGIKNGALGARNLITALKVSIRANRLEDARNI